MTTVKKITAALLCLTMLLSLMGCASRTRVEQEAFIQACTDVGLGVESTDTASMNESGLTEHVLATSDNANAELLTYDTETRANQVYAEAMSSMVNENATVEKKIDSAGYKKYFISNGDTFTALVLVDCTIVYGKQDTNNDIIRNLMKEINYN